MTHITGQVLVLGLVLLLLYLNPLMRGCCYDSYHRPGPGTWPCIIITLPESFDERLLL